MEEINEIKIPKGVESISVTQHDDKIVIEFIAEKRKFKEGDFLHSDWHDENITIIFKNQAGDHIYYHASKSCYYGVIVNNDRFWRDDGDFRLATEEEKQELLDALAKNGKRWNAEKLIVEDIQKRKFKDGDKVRIKDGISSKTHRYVSPNFKEPMDEFIGKELTVKKYSYLKWVVFYEDDYGYQFDEDWLEPYTEELKKGDLAIFWDNNDNESASIRMYDRKDYSGYYDSCGFTWDNAMKFESKEQFEKILNGKV